MIATAADRVVAFRRTMEAAGLEPPETIAPGRLHRFATNGRRSDTAGWCLLFEDQEGGAFGDWRTGLRGAWRARAETEYTPEQRADLRRRIAAARAEAEAQQVERQKRAAERAQRLWKRAGPADPSHPYLQRKGVRPHYIRQLGATLVIPLWGTDRNLYGLQFISADGKKRFLKHMAKRGHFHIIGRPAGMVVVAEGYATAATIHEATGYATATSFDAGNVRPVVEAIRERLPEVGIIIAADNDHGTVCRGHQQEGLTRPFNEEVGRPEWCLCNPGLLAATDAARAVGAALAVPPFGDEEYGTDWNDVAATHGREAVAAGIEAAAAPVRPQEPREEIILDPKDPYPGAKLFLERRYSHREEGVLLHTLHEQGGQFFGYNGRSYPEIEESGVRAELWNFAARAMRWKLPTKKDAEPELHPFQPTTTTVNNLLDALRGQAHLPSRLQAPCWFPERGGDPPALALVPLANGLLDVQTRQFFDHTPRFFVHHALPFAYDPAWPPPRPEAWLAFLHQLWPDDPESIATLQELFGYLLTHDTRQQKCFLLVGPPRSGKGTIARVLTGLLGSSNVCAPTLADLA
ncbi:MAG: toprim domain-containing protein, partial [Gemmatimonadetes bacterium]|nr:toprim domain-containing protein [Gemmatimonadota bacterium]